MINNYKEAKEILLDAIKYNDGLENFRYIDDLILELADSNVDVYTSDLYEWAGTNIGHDYTKQAIDEFGWDGVGAELDKAYMMGQYLRNSELLTEALDDIREELREEQGTD